MNRIRLVVGALLVTLGLVIPIASNVSAAPVVDAEANSAAYWESQFPGTQCWKHDPPQYGDTHGYLTNTEPTAVVLNPFNPAWTGYSGWAVLIVKGGTDNAVYVNPSDGVPYYAPTNGGSNVADVSHWIVCKTIDNEEEAPVASHVNNVDSIECGDTEWSATVTVTVTDTQWNLGWSSDGVAWQQVTELAPGSYTITFGPYPATDRFVQINVYAWWDGGSYDTNRPGRQWDALEPTHYSCPDTTVPTEETVPDTTVPVTTVPVTTTPPVTTVPTPETTTVTTIVIPEPTPTTLAPTPVPTVPKVNTTKLPTTGTDPGVLIALAVIALIVGTVIVTEERRARRNRRKPVADMEVIY